MIRVLLLTLSVFLALPVLAASDFGTPTRSITAIHAPKAPVIDGRLDEECWKLSEAASGFSVYSNPKVRHGEQTTARVCFTDDYLYLGIHGLVQNEREFARSLRETAGRFEYGKGATIELFLDPGGDQRTYQQYLFHANGTKIYSVSTKELARVINADFVQSATALTADGFNIEARIPFASLGLDTKSVGSWGINLNRCHDLYGEGLDDGPKEHDERYSSWNSTGGKPFGSPDLFGRLEIKKDFSPWFLKVSLPVEPEAGQASIDFDVANETGHPFRGTASLLIENGKTEKYQQPLQLQPNRSARVSFRRLVTARDENAKYLLKLADERGRVRYFGGTQKVDETPADTVLIVKPTREEAMQGFVIFRNRPNQPPSWRNVPRAQDRMSRVSVDVARGEFEALSIGLHALRDIRDMRVSVSDLQTAAGLRIPSSAITVGQVTYQSLWRDTSHFVSAPHLVRPASVVDLDKGRSLQLWMTLHTPGNALPGIYRGSVSLSAHGMSRRLPIEVRVVPFSLADSGDMGYFMYFYGPGQLHSSLANESVTKTIVDDMRDHGMTTFTNYYWAAIADKQTQKLVMDVDTHIDPRYGMTYSHLMRLLQGAGLGSRAPLLMIQGGAYVNTDSGPQLLLELERYHNERRWPRNAFYIDDEVDTPARIARARATLNKLRADAPSILTTTALGDSGSAAVGSLYDIWIGPRTPALIARCRSFWKRPWTYSARPIYEMSPAFARFFYGQNAYALGLEGVGLWCYAENNVFVDRFGERHGYTAGFHFPSAWKQEHGYVVMENGKPVPTIAWEAVREGVDDYRYLRTLQREASSAAASGIPAQVLAGKAGLSLLEKIKRENDWQYAYEDLVNCSLWQKAPDIEAMRTKVIAALLRIGASRGSSEKSLQKIN